MVIMQLQEKNSKLFFSDFHKLSGYFEGTKISLARRYRRPHFHFSSGEVVSQQTQIKRNSIFTHG